MEKEAKQNENEFFCATSMIRCLDDFNKLTGFKKPFCPPLLRSLHIYFHPSQNVYST